MKPTPLPSRVPDARESWGGDCRANSALSNSKLMPPGMWTRAWCHLHSGMVDFLDFKF